MKQKMALSQVHFRSISLPSRLHAINSTGLLEAEIQKLKSWQISCISESVPITPETIQCGLLALVEVYNSVDELSQSPATWTSVHNLDGKSIDIEGSVELLDSCNTLKELVQMVRENVHNLQSALRRKGLDSSIKNDITSYFCVRKKMNKCIAKSLKTLKNLENKNGSNLSLSRDEGFARVLREVSGLTIDTFKSTLLFLSSPTVKSGRWNLVSRLKLIKTVASGKDFSVISGVECVDFTLNNFRRSLRNSDSEVVDHKQMLQRSLQNLESCVEGTEAGLERLFRQLLQSRVTLLNILTDH